MLKPHQERVVDELKDLQERLDKLHNFISSEKFDEIVNDEYERQRMIYQRHCMQQYAFALQDRISNFK